MVRWADMGRPRFKPNKPNRKRILKRGILRGVLLVEPDATNARLADVTGMSIATVERNAPDIREKLGLPPANRGRPRKVTTDAPGGQPPTPAEAVAE